MKKLYIIKAGSTFAETAAKHGDFDDMICRGLDIGRNYIHVIDAPRGEVLPVPESCLGVIITGAHCMVTDDLPWSLAIETWIPALVAAKTPLLGICYGHQLLGRAMGGQVDFHPGGKEIGTVTVRLKPESHNDPLFGKTSLQFPAHTTHAQSILTLPPNAFALVENDLEPHHAFRLGPCAWGVQFHPEYNSDIMRDYIVQQADTLTRSGQDINAMLKGLQETSEASSILKTFAQLVIKGESL